MKQGPFAHRGLCCPAADIANMAPSDSLWATHHFPGAPVIGRTCFPTPAGPGPRRASPVPATPFCPFHVPYAGGFFGICSRFPDAFHGLRQIHTGSAPSLSHPSAGALTTLQTSLHAADRTVASPRFDPGLSTGPGGFTTGDPGISPDRTSTGWLPRACRPVTS